VLIDYTFLPLIQVVKIKIKVRYGTPTFLYSKVETLNQK